MNAFDMIMDRAVRQGDCLVFPPQPPPSSGIYSYIKDEDGQIKRASRVVAAHVYGPANGLQVLHSCDNRRCVEPAHLRYGTHAENMADRAARDRTARGERHGQHKLSADAVREIRGRVASGEKQSDLAHEFGVYFSTVWKVVHGETWGWVA
jgi:hypothetical protein